MQIEKVREIIFFSIVLLFTVPAGAGANGTIEGAIEGLGKGPFVIYVEKAPEESGRVPDTAPIMNQQGNTFVPHVLPVVAGSKVEFRSEDPELHNIYAKLLPQTVLFNIGIPPGAPKMFQTFAKEGVVKLTCNVHREMLAFILVLQNPYFAVVEKGADRFRIGGVPAGDYQIRIWGEKLEEPAASKRFPVSVAANGSVRLSIKE